MRAIKFSMFALLFASSALLVTRPAAAHHSAAMFDDAKVVELKGTIKEMQWTNPHIWVYMEVPKDGGGTDLYAFEGMTPNFLSRRGWTRQTVQPGMKFTVTFRPMRDGKPGGMFVSGTLESGKVLTMGGGEQNAAQ